jgi:hypothetical protein
MVTGAVAIAGLAGLAWGSPIMTRLISDVDFPFHIETAESFAATGRITMPHFLLQVLLGSVLATGVTSARAALVFFQALYALAAALICWYIVRRAGEAAGAGRASEAGGVARAVKPAEHVVYAIGAMLAVILAVAVLMSAPIFPRGELDLYLIGYFPANVYHNPTMVLARPLLVLALACAVAAVTRTGPLTMRELVLLTLPVVLLGLAKPNYLGCLAPAVVVAAIWKHVTAVGGNDDAVSWARVGAVGGAAVSTVAAMWVLYRSLELGEGAGLTFAPLAVIGHYAEVDASSITRSIAGSLAFPLVMTVLWPLSVWRDAGMRIAWAGTVVGLFVSYFVAEAGSRLYDGNLLWTGQMAVFVLFVAAAAFLLNRLTRTRLRAITLARALAASGVLILHVQSGVRHVGVKVELPTWLALWT